MSDTRTALPAELEEAIAARDADVVERWDEGPRTYLHLNSAVGKLFARTSSDPDDVATIQHEATVRALVGTDGPLRAPEVLASGPDWMLEAGMTSESIHGTDAIEAVIRAAEKLRGLDLPVQEEHPQQTGGGALRRRFKLLGSGIRIRDLVTARKILTEDVDASVTSHGDFHIGNVFYTDGALWVVDWEMVDQRPAGYDLMQFWPSIERAEDRDLFFERAVETIGEAHRRNLARLRYALLVRTIANKLGATREFNLDVEGGRRLLKLLPPARTAAF